MYIRQNNTPVEEGDGSTHWTWGVGSMHLWLLKITGVKWVFMLSIGIFLALRRFHRFFSAKIIHAFFVAHKKVTSSQKYVFGALILYI
jgi:hypothetical protein